MQGVRALAARRGRDPRSVRFFATLTPVVGRTDEEARARYEELRRYASVTGGLVLFSGWTGIDISGIPLDQELTAADSAEAHKVRSVLDSFTAAAAAGGGEVPRWTPRLVAERACIGGLGPVAVGSPQTVADELERWVREADVDGFNLGYVTTPGTFEEVVDLLVPELRRRGLYPGAAPEGEQLTAREKIYGRGQKELLDDHTGSRYKYDVYEEEAPYEEVEEGAGAGAGAGSSVAEVAAAVAAATITV